MSVPSLFCTLNCSTGRFRKNKNKFQTNKLGQHCSQKATVESLPGVGLWRELTNVQEEISLGRGRIAFVLVHKEQLCSSGGFWWCTGSCSSPCVLYLRNSEVVALRVVKRAVDLSQAVCSLGQLSPIEWFGMQPCNLPMELQLLLWNTPSMEGRDKLPPFLLQKRDAQARRLLLGLQNMDQINGP